MPFSSYIYKLSFLKAFVLILALIMLKCSIHMSVQSGNIKRVQRYLDRGGDVNAHSVDYNLLTHAIEKDNPEIVKLLIEAGATVTCKDIIYAGVLSRKPEIVSMLVNASEDVNCTYIRGNTPLKISSFNGYIKIVERLLQKGADIHNNDSNFTALMSAAEGGNFEIVKLLIDKGADINARGYYSELKELRTALIDAARAPNDNVEMIKYLLNQGADLHAGSDIDYNNFPAWYHALYKSNFNSAKFLIQKGIKLPVGVGVLVCRENLSVRWGIQWLGTRGKPIFPDPNVDYGEKYSSTLAIFESGIYNINAWYSAVAIDNPALNESASLYLVKIKLEAGKIYFMDYERVGRKLKPKIEVFVILKE